jgi:hypothetical protein
MKQNDWIIASLNNPEFTPDDFKDVGFNLQNTELVSEDEYKKSKKILENPKFQKNG